MSTANNKLNVSNLDFNGIKAGLVEFLKTAKDANDNLIFTDYNFNASGISTILDVLAYNTHIQSLMANFVANEMFLDTAAKRSSVVSHAKSLGYTPRSTTCAKIPLTLIMDDPTPVGQTRPSTQNIPKNTRIISQSDEIGLTFLTTTDYTATWQPNYNNGKYVATDVVFYEGVYTTNTFTYNRVDPYYRIPNTKCDTSTLRVWVKEPGEATFLEYTKIGSFLSVSFDTTCYFVQESISGGFEIYFGDGNFGYKPQTDATVKLEYVVTNGDIGNGCVNFVVVSTLEGSSVVINQTDSNNEIIESAGGNDLESTLSIKRQAINHYGSQNRAVIPADYESLVMTSDASNIKDIRCWGGEDDTPPQYNAIVMCVVPEYGDYITTSDQNHIKAVVKPKAVGNVNILFKNPDYIDMIVNNVITYDPNRMSMSVYELEQKSKTTIIDYTASVSSFSGVFRSSNLIAMLDIVDDAVVSNNLSIKLAKFIRVDLLEEHPIKFTFNNSLSNQYATAAVESENFYTDGYDALVRFIDDGLGNINVISVSTKTVIKRNIGSVNYTTGDISIMPINITKLTAFELRFTAQPLDTDIRTSRNHIVRISPTRNTVSVSSRVMR